MKEAIAECLGTCAFVVMVILIVILISAGVNYIIVKVGELFGYHFDGLDRSEKSKMFNYYMYGQHPWSAEGEKEMEIPANAGMRVGDVVRGGTIVGFIGYNQPDKDDPNHVFYTEETCEMYDDAYTKAQWLSVNADIITVKAIVRMEEN